jgi:hypothetical protein
MLSVTDSGVDRQRFDADPDPTFYLNAEPYPKLGQFLTDQF